jgi:hypothetical protein
LAGWIDPADHVDESLTLGSADALLRLSLVATL